MGIPGLVGKGDYLPLVGKIDTLDPNCPDYLTVGTVIPLTFGDVGSLKFPNLPNERV